MFTELKIKSDERICINIGKNINDKMFNVNLDKNKFLDLIKQFDKICDKEKMMVFNEKHYTDFKYILKVNTEGDMNCYSRETIRVDNFKGVNYDLRTSVYKEREVSYYNINLERTIGNEVKVFTIVMKHKYYEVHFKTKMNPEKESFYEISFILTSKYTRNGLSDILNRLGEHKLKIENTYSNDDVFVSV